MAGLLTVAFGAGVTVGFKDGVETTVVVPVRGRADGFASRCLATKASEGEKSERLKKSLISDSIESV